MGTDWDSLQHAYGSASDAPQRLAGLLSEDPQTCGEALSYLDATLLHQDSLYSATAPAAQYVAAILPDPRLNIACESALPWDDRQRPLRAALLEWLGSVAESAILDTSIFDAEGLDSEGLDGENAALLACRAIVGDLYLAVAPYVTDSDEQVRSAAAGAVAFLLMAPALHAYRAEHASRLLRDAQGAPRRERASVALTLGRWGLAPTALLSDEDPGVRACAALAPALDNDPAALEEIKAALRDPEAADAWFEQPLPQLWGRFRFALIEALLRRTNTFEEIVEPAVAVARMTNAFTVGSDWGPLLERAFPRGYRKDDPLSEPQRRFLEAIVENQRCWQGVANPVLWLQRVGLPYSREDLRSLR